jgi:energy-coupling factor transporter ATP-binding protein EcfA2
VQRGEFVGILGANDSGKTTIAKLCNGLFTPSAGEVHVEGQCVGKDLDIHEVRRKIGVVFADPENQIVGTTVEEEIAFGLGNLCVPPKEMRHRIDAMLDVVGLRQYALREPHRLSGGEQQKLCLASVLAMRPECLILDSPLTFLDSVSREEILGLLRRLHVEGNTLLYCTSDPEELLDADRILLLNKGQLFKECTPQHLWEVPNFLKQVEIMPSPLMLFREAFRKQGSALQNRN